MNARLGLDSFLAQPMGPGVTGQTQEANRQDLRTSTELISHLSDPMLSTTMRFNWKVLLFYKKDLGPRCHSKGAGVWLLCVQQKPEHLWAHMWPPYAARGTQGALSQETTVILGRAGRRWELNASVRQRGRRVAAGVPGFQQALYLSFSIHTADDAPDGETVSGGNKSGHGVVSQMHRRNLIRALRSWARRRATSPVG